MATNYIQPGKVLDFDAPYDRTTGQGFQVGSIFAVALGTALSTVAIRGQIDGVWTLAKTSAQAWTVGQKIYWDNTNKRCDSASTVGMLIGVAQAVAANPAPLLIPCHRVVRADGGLGGFGGGLEMKRALLRQEGVRV